MVTDEAHFFRIFGLPGGGDVLRDNLKFKFDRKLSLLTNFGIHSGSKSIKVHQTKRSAQECMMIKSHVRACTIT